MAPKKAAKAADGEEVDLSCEQLMKFYRKNCATYQIKVNEQLRKAYGGEDETKGGRSGSFETTRGEELLFSKLARHRFPEDEEILHLLDPR